jgi:hypothetical protein
MSSEKSRQEQRHFTRILIDSAVRLVSAEGGWDSTLIDISLKGALIKTPAMWRAKIGDRLLMELALNDGETIIRMEVSVAHMEEGHVGLRCEHIDIDSISHLRRLVELNVGDPEVLFRELGELSKLPSE